MLNSDLIVMVLSARGGASGSAGGHCSGIWMIN
jgi:hypothetical protein